MVLTVISFEIFQILFLILVDLKLISKLLILLKSSENRRMVLRGDRSVIRVILEATFGEDPLL